MEEKSRIKGGEKCGRSTLTRDGKAGRRAIGYWRRAGDKMISNWSEMDFKIIWKTWVFKDVRMIEWYVDNVDGMEFVG